jgi:hypothetical protein
MTEGLHSREALELIKEHLLGIMGPTADSRFSTQLLKMSKFQMAQVRRGEGLSGLMSIHHSAAPQPGHSPPQHVHTVGR